jgi:Oxygen evolving enhancer protein 3 (PsbQ)
MLISAGTLNSDQARDLDLPLKERFYLQPKSPSEAAARVKESAKEIINLKSQIDKKAWPYVQNDLRSRAQYLRYDLKTVIASKPKEEKQTLKKLYGQLFTTLDGVSSFSFYFVSISMHVYSHRVQYRHLARNGSPMSGCIQPNCQIPDISLGSVNNQ